MTTACRQSMFTSGSFVSVTMLASAANRPCIHQDAGAYCATQHTHTRCALITDVSNQATQHGNGTLRAIASNLSLVCFASSRFACADVMHPWSERWLVSLCGLVGALTPRGVISQLQRRR
jgi:hypothetical protein